MQKNFTFQNAADHKVLLQFSNSLNFPGGIDMPNTCVNFYCNTVSLHPLKSSSKTAWFYSQLATGILHATIISTAAFTRRQGPFIEHNFKRARIKGRAFCDYQIKAVAGNVRALTWICVTFWGLWNILVMICIFLNHFFCGQFLTNFNETKTSRYGIKMFFFIDIAFIFFILLIKNNNK